jgi:hypothetical protein
VLPTEEGARVTAGDVGEVLAPLEREELAAVADGPQQRHAERPGADSRLDHAGAGEDVGHRHDLRRVLGIDHRGAARHRHDVVRQQRAQSEVLGARGVGDDRAVGCSDEDVVGQSPRVRVELATRLEGDGVEATLGVGELDPVTHPERPSARVRAHARVLDHGRKVYGWQLPRAALEYAIWWRLRLRGLPRLVTTS